MTNGEFRRKNHYVPCSYLKRWTSCGGHLWTYRILVPHSSVPLWKQNRPTSVAYHAHLYTQIIGGQETDEFERWLDSEIEAPAQGVLQKVVDDVRLTPGDWRRLIRFVAAQDVRTPARLAEQISRWHETLPSVLEMTLQRSVRKMEEAVRTNRHLPIAPHTQDDGLPLRVITKRELDHEMGQIGVEVVVGRGLWLWSIKRALEKTAQVLNRHKWTILLPPSGMNWFTSDSPVMRLNYFSASNYNFHGGWDSPGTEIMMPLSPQHLLYTKIGEHPPFRRGERLSGVQADLIRGVIAEHAHRLIFSVDQDSDVSRLRPRVVDSDAYRREQELWNLWHDQQSAAELDVNSDDRVH